MTPPYFPPSFKKGLDPDYCASQLDLQSLVVQSVGVLMGSELPVTGKVPLTFCAYTEFGTMQLPRQITIVDSIFLLDGGTVVLCAISDDGANCSIQLNQRMFSGSYSDHPGRLYFNNELVSVRSEHESRIVQLLKAATIRSAPVERSPTSEPPLSKNAMILSDDIKEFLNSSPQENLHRFRNEILAFVESEEYVRIATLGLP